MVLFSDDCFSPSNYSSWGDTCTCSSSIFVRTSFYVQASVAENLSRETSSIMFCFNYDHEKTTTCSLSKDICTHLMKSRLLVCYVVLNKINRPSSPYSVLVLHIFDLSLAHKTAIFLAKTVFVVSFITLCLYGHHYMSYYWYSNTRFPSQL